MDLELFSANWASVWLAEFVDRFFVKFVRQEASQRKDRFC